DPEPRARPIEDAGARRLAERLPAVAVPLRRRFRPGGPPASAGRAGDGAGLRRGRPPARPLPPRRDADHLEPDGASLADPARRLRGGGPGAQRLGARPCPPPAEVQPPAP